MTSQKSETSTQKDALEAELANAGEGKKTAGRKPNKAKAKFANALNAAVAKDVSLAPALVGGKKETRAITVDIRETSAAIYAAKNKEKAERAEQRTASPQAQEMRRRLGNILNGTAEWVDNPYAEGKKKFCSSGMQVEVSNCYIVFIKNGAVVRFPTSNLAMEVSQDMLTEERSRQNMAYHELLRKDRRWNRVKIVRGEKKADTEAEHLQGLIEGRIRETETVISALERRRDDLDSEFHVRALVDEDDLVSLTKCRWSELEALRRSLNDDRLEDPFEGEGPRTHFVILKIGEGERNGEVIDAAFIIPISRSSVAKIRTARENEEAKPAPDAEKLRLLELHEIPRKYDDARNPPFKSFITAVRAAKKS